LRKSKIPLDPWQQEYHYVSPGEHGKFDLFTLGADGKDGGDGEDQDIVSWE
jgi:general secretion pathway protein G